jgi:toxin ParE1/3/4
MPSIRRTAQAEEDLIDLWLYVAQDNPRTVDHLFNEIGDKCSLLAGNPQPGPARPDIAEDC